MREVMALTERTDVISLAGGLPDTSTFPPERFAKLMSVVAAESTARALQYGPTEGMRVTAERIVEVMAAEGTVVDPESVIVTTGGQQVIDLVCKTLIDPGDVIVAEAPTYPGAVPTFTAYQADVEQIDVDEEGMPIDELERTLDRLASEGRRPKFIYTIPNFQNPAGVTMSLARRRRLVEVARERELLVLEDNPYGLLRYEGEALPTLYSLDAESLGRAGATDLVIYLGTFSKILSPGLRLGWAVAPRPVLEKLNLGKQGADLCASPVTQMFVAAYFAERARDGRPAWEEYVESLRKLYSRRKDVMLESLQEHFGDSARWTSPRGGLFVWATLDERIDTTDLLALAQERRGGVRARAGGLHGRPAGVLLDAPELRRRPRAGHPRGHPAHRAGRARPARPAGHAHGLPVAPSPTSGRRQTTVEEPAAGGEEASGQLADVVKLPRRENSQQARRRGEK